jgi:hypothetical protein
MVPDTFIIPMILVIACTGSIFYLLRTLRQQRQLVALLGLFCMAMGVFLLILDIVLITLIHGPQHIPGYLMFNRLVSDGGFAGRWVLTVYIFIGAGLLTSIYLLAMNLITKSNKKLTGEDL